MTVLRGYAIINKFQSTHPRGVRPDRLRILFRMYIVSIHAPAWGATKSSFGCRGSSAVSIHAPSWGATRSGREQYRDRSRFNPRTRVGCDAHIAERIGEHVGFNPRTRVGCDWYEQAVAAGYKVSIHAPAWGATGERRGHHSGGGGFNPRTRVGCDIRATASLPTPRSFNPRTRVGCDPSLSWRSGRWPRFQSTHPRGVRPGGPLFLQSCWLFQSTHPRGVRPAHYEKFIPPTPVSIHAPAWGATVSNFSGDHPCPVSIHAPAWGATHF